MLVSADVTMIQSEALMTDGLIVRIDCHLAEAGELAPFNPTTLTCE